MSVERFMGSAEALGEREIGVIASTDQLARDGHIVEPTGIDLTAFRRCPTILFNHDPARIVGTATAVGVDELGRLAARIEFAPQGMSADADMVCDLAKAGVIRGISIGFQPLEMEPIDPKEPWSGQRILSCDLLEISVVGTPADTGAMVVARSFSQIPGAARLLRGLPRVSAAAIDRAAALMVRADSKPVGLMNEYERAAYYREQQRLRTMGAWASSQARAAEDQERRRQRVAELRAIDEARGSTRQ